MKTASLGLLEVPVVRVNAGGDAPRTPPLLVMSRAIPPFFVFLQKVFYVEAEGRSGERDGIRHARERFFFSAGELELRANLSTDATSRELSALSNGEIEQ